MRKQGQLKSNVSCPGSQRRASFVPFYDQNVMEKKGNLSVNLFTASPLCENIERGKNYLHGSRWEFALQAQTD